MKDSFNSDTTTLAHIVKRVANQDPTQKAFIFLGDNLSREQVLTYGGLHEQAARLASFLRNHGNAGEPVVLLFPPGPEFIVALLGCLYAAMPAVPMYPPRSSRRDVFTADVITDSKTRLILTTTAYMQRTHDLCSANSLSPAIFDSAGITNTHTGSDFFDPQPQALAFLQYTSGSTGTPKGVMVTHQTLLANSRAIAETFGTTPDDLCVSWLPLYHDMGLIGTVFQALYRGFPSVLIPSLSFLRRPLVWLETISRYKATLSGGPNFAYQACLRAAANQVPQNLDLSSWRVAFNGAEPVRPETLHQFAETFSPHGFNAHALFPCYGMAEATLLISAHSGGRSVRHVNQKALTEHRIELHDQADTETVTLASCGKPIDGHEVVIAHPETLTLLPEHQVGEIWFSGPSRCPGYWGDEARTQTDFHAAPAGTGAHQFLRTGDLGFMANGELFVCGRLKDMVIVRGRNYYAQDLEQVAALAHEALLPDAAIAFAIQPEAGQGDNAERVVLVHEVHRKFVNNTHGIAQSVRAAVAQAFEIQVHDVVLLKPGTLPKTTSGKPRRRTCRKQYLAETLPTLSKDTLRNQVVDTPMERLSPEVAGQDTGRVQTWLTQTAARAMRIAPSDVQPDVALVAQGLDSLAAAELEQQLTDQGWHAPAAYDLLDGMTPVALVAHLQTHVGTAHAQAETVVETDALSFEQLRLWTLDQLNPGHASAHIPAAFTLIGSLDTNRLQAALDLVSARHESLRTVFTTHEGAPVRRILDPTPMALPMEDLSDLSAAEQTHALNRLLDREARAPFQLHCQAPIRTLLVRLAPQAHVLSLTCHHIATDLMSLEIILDELTQIYNHGRDNAQPALNPAPIYSRFVGHQKQHLTAEHLQPDMDFWRENLQGMPANLPLPTDFPRPLQPTLQGKQVTLNLSTKAIPALRDLARQEQTTLFTIMLAGYAAMLHRFTGATDMVIGVPVSGRARHEDAHAVGYYAYPLPVRLKGLSGMSFRQIIQLTREAFLNVLRHSNTPLTKVLEAAAPSQDPARHPLFQVVFGFFDKALPQPKFNDIEVQALSPDKGATSFDLFTSLYMDTDCFEGAVTYNSDVYEGVTIQRLNAFYQTCLEHMAQQPDSAPSDCKRPSELPQVAAQPASLRVISNFTADPLLPVLDYWNQATGNTYHIETAPYGQVFQALLQGQQATQIMVLRLEDWFGGPEAAREPLGDTQRAQLERTLSDFTAAVETSATQVKAPLLIFLCPPSEALQDNPGRLRHLNTAEGDLLRTLNAISGVHAFSTDQLQADYAVTRIHDAVTDKAGHIPYTADFFTALGTFAMRRLNLLHRKPYKVLVLDCDNTLWRGVCGEDGPEGVLIDEGFATLQDFVSRLQENGMLLALCSKNRAADVQAVFEQNPNMRLKLTQILARRVNWQPKSQNIQELAAELNLGLNSFIFLDDNPVELAEVRERCPQVLCLKTPTESDAIPGFLNRVWAFDHSGVSKEDRQRTEMYRGNIARHQARAAVTSLTDFLKRLELNIEITEMDDIDRVSQLTFRTNQFNASTIRRDVQEIEALLASDPHAAVRVTRVRDRFGDYGLVGAAIYTNADTHLKVDTLLLSCRALGKGVEHQMLADLAGIALSRGLTHVAVPFVPSERNQPMADFLNAVTASCPEPLEDHIFPAAWLQNLKLDPQTEEKATIATNTARETNRPAVFNEQETYDAAALLADMRRNVSSENTHEAPQTPSEKSLAEIWSRYLYIDQVGRRTNFFHLGGNSVTATQIISDIYQTFGVELSVREFFTTPTIAELAEKLPQIESSQEDDLDDLLAQLEDMSDEEASLLLVEKMGDESATRLNPDTAYRRTPYTGYPLGGDRHALIVEGREEPVVLHKDTVSAMEELAHFAPASDHIDRLSASTGRTQEQVTDTLTDLHLQGLLTAQDRFEAEVIERYGNHHTPTPITALGIPTCNRVQGCRRGLSTYVENALRFGRDIEFVLMDDSRDPAICEDYRQMVRNLSAETGARISYAGIEEKAAFKKALIDLGNVPPEVVRFTLEGDKWDSFTGGSNANALLLHTQGQVFLSVDDDTLCKLVVSPGETQDATLFRSVQRHYGDSVFPCKVQTFDTRDDLQTAIAYKDEDLISVHEKVLGQSPGAALAGFGYKDKCDISEANDRLIRDMRENRGNILITLHGIAGDSGWSTPGIYLLMDGVNFERFTRTEEEYRKACTRREMLKMVERTTVVDQLHNMMSTFMGLDNRHLLPPRIPVGRGEDVVLGMVLTRCFQDGYYAHVNRSLLHMPVESRRFNEGEIFKSATGIDIFLLISSCLKSLDFHPGEETPAERLIALGKHFTWLSKRHPLEFEEVIRTKALQHISLYVEYVYQLLIDRSGAPKWWADDVNRFVDLIQQSVKRDGFFTPLEMQAGRSLADARNLAQDYIGKIGGLFTWWPQLVADTMTLRERGITPGHAMQQTPTTFTF